MKMAGNIKRKVHNNLVKQTYLLLSTTNFKFNKKNLWVVHDTWDIEDKYDFISVDKRKYGLCMSKKRPTIFCIPYELFLEDEYGIG